MSDENPVPTLPEGLTLTMFSFKATTQFELFSQAREHYFHAVNQLKAQIKNVPLELLIEISENTGPTTKTTDPDLIPERNVTITDAARSEIHRRAFQGFTIAPLRKGKLNGSGLGFLRKPKF